MQRKFFCPFRREEGVNGYTTRNISAKALHPQVLSNLLWAAFGVNREKGSFGKPGRTAASASNSQEIDLYVALPEGAYLYLTFWR
jgi:hypothetical protein